MKRRWLRSGFLVYSVLMLWLLFGQRFGTFPDTNYWQIVRENLNLIPFDTIKRFEWVLNHSSVRGLVLHAVINLVGNVIMFVPLGWFYPVLWQRLRKFPWLLLWLLLTILSIETLQLFTLLGSFDVDDVLLNMVGALLGFGVWKLGVIAEKK